ncbi:hypothetical protein BTHE_1950 [Bifidobacterium thermophilum]|nr:hypothetical protein BTHE_1950 [Bifidobacterium thermophilum]
MLHLRPGLSSGGQLRADIHVQCDQDVARRPCYPGRSLIPVGIRQLCDCGVARRAGMAPGALIPAGIKLPCERIVSRRPSIVGKTTARRAVGRSYSRADHRGVVGLPRNNRYVVVSRLL